MPKTKARPPRKSEKPAADKNPGGRRSKLTEALSDAIITMVAGGMTYVDAARANGIGESTFHAWRQRGEHERQEAERREKMTVAALKKLCKHEDLPTTGKKADLLERLADHERPFVEFVEGIEKAEAERKFIWLGEIAGADDWKARAWLLERIYPHEYSRRTVTELVGKDDGPIDIATTSVDERAEMEKTLAKMQERSAARPKLAAVPDPEPAEEPAPTKAKAG